MSAYISERLAFVNAICPVDCNAAAKTSYPIYLGNYERVCFVIAMGVENASASTVVTVNKSAATSGGTAIGFVYRVSSTAASGGTFCDGALTAVTTANASSGITIANKSYYIYTIEVNASDIGKAYPYVILNLASPGSYSSIKGVIAVLGDTRFEQDGMVADH